MLTPTVIQISRALEVVGRDTFIAAAVRQPERPANVVQLASRARRDRRPSVPARAA